jgi:hypothetical protein
VKRGPLPWTKAFGTRDRFGQAADAGLIQSREHAINAWISVYVSRYLNGQIETTGNVKAGSTVSIPVEGQPASMGSGGGMGQVDHEHADSVRHDDRGAS